MQSAVEDNKAVVRRFVTEFVNGGDESIVDELFAEDYVRHEPGASVGRQGVEAFVAMLRAFRSAFPDVELVVEEMVAEGDVVVFRGTERGTHEGEFLGFVPTGKAFEMAGMAMHRLEDGRIAETWATWDRVSMYRQLGIDPL